ncbi:MAG: DegT/DnrJ/EryC1/StrS family aminotransferase, partial [Ruminococcaceae bacterium]|nr:DegT/DnrJ/EryC1/StrS family aminotransferase [Oscillospiraceae bacterium]
YVLGKEVSAFEGEFAAFLNARCCAGVANGLDALKIAVRLFGIGKGDEVIVPANTYIATVMGVTDCGATPVFCEPDEYYNIDPDKVEALITSKTKAVMPVNLYGQACRLDKIREICDRHGLLLIEDSAQSHGAKCAGRYTNFYADASCFSFYPTKNFGCFGDGGAIVSDNEKLDADVRVFRNYGSEKRYYNREIGVNSRLDEIQAGLLRVKLNHAKELQDMRDALAKRYLEGIENPLVALPRLAPECTSVWHQFVLRVEEREEFIEFLSKHEIGTLIHYPVPPHLSQAYAYLGFKKGDFPIAESYADTVVSIPFFPGLNNSDADRIISVINSFRR